MGLGRIITILFFVWLGYFLYRRYIRGYVEKREQKKSSQQKSIENTVRCAHCDLHLPEHEAIRQNGRYYCSQEHADSAQEH